MAVRGASRPVQRLSKPRSTSIVSITARLLTWYTLYTIFFVCPPSTDTQEPVPVICKGYTSVADFVSPHLSPYYNTHVAPHWEPVKSNYVLPALKSSQQAYTTYAQPHVQKAQAASYTAYDKNLRPKVNSLQIKGGELYSQYAARHVSTVQDVYIQLVNDYIYPASTVVGNTYRDNVLPAYHSAQPYVESALGNAQQALFTVVVPSVQTGYSQVNGWVDKSVLPRVRIMWKDSVEPQLVRIGERMWRRRERDEVMGVVQDSGYEEHIQAIPTPVEDATTISQPIATSPINSTPDTQAAQSDKTVDMEKAATAAAIRATLENDLTKWQTKFAEAGKKASQDLAERLDKITARAISVEKSVIADKLQLLESSIFSELELFKSRAAKTVKVTYDGNEKRPTDEKLSHGEEVISKLTRDAGTKIRDQSVAVRERSQTFLNNLYDQASTAADTTLEVLDSVRDVGMHEIGMKWAWMDGVTYKDWAKYHDLKKIFQKIRNDVVDEAQEHEGLVEAEKFAKEAEEEVNAVAAEAAEELARVKAIAKRKLAVGNFDANWEVSWIPEGIEKLTKQAEENLSSAVAAIGDLKNQASTTIVGTSQGTIESIASVVTEAAESIASGAASKVGMTTQGSLESIASVVTEAAVDAASSASSAVVGTSTPVTESVATQVSEYVQAAKEKIQKPVIGGAQAVEVFGREITFDREPDDDDETYTEKAKLAADKISSAVSEAIYGTTQGTVESMTSVAKDQYDAAWTAASNAIYGTPVPATESVYSAVKDKYAQAVFAASTAIYGTPTPLPQSLAAEASKSYADLAASASTKYDAAMEYIEERYRLAVQEINARVGKKDKRPDQKAVDEANRLFNAGVANAKDAYTAALSQASLVAYGTPTPVAQSLANRAGEYATQVTNAADERYEQLKAYISELVSGKEPDFTESVMSRMSTLLYGTEAGIYARATSGAAEAYASATSAANEAISTASTIVAAAATLPPSVENILNQANEQFQSAINAASVAIYGTQKGTIEQATSALGESIAAATSYAGEKIDQATAVVNEYYEDAASRVSTAIYGTPTGVAEAATSSISAAYESAQKAISEAIYGTEQGYFEYATSIVGENYEYATSFAGDNIDSATSAISDTYAKATDAAAAGYESVSSAIGETAEEARKKAYEAYYGKQKSQYEIAMDNLKNAMERTQNQLAAFARSGQEGAETVLAKAEEVMSSATEEVKKAYTAVRDEL